MLQKMTVIAALLTCATALAQSSKVDYRKIDRELQLRNAARLDNGGRIRLELLASDVFKDARTSPPAVVDGNVHSRQVVTGAPYRFHIELIDELPIEAIYLIDSDYVNETCPKDIEVKLSDGTTYRKSLEKLPAERRQPKPRQTIDVGGKRARWVEVTVLNNHPGGVSKRGTPIGWGGLGEIEVITTADLSPYLTITDFNPQLPQDIRGEAPRSDYSNVTVTLPDPIPLGQQPGIYLTAVQWQELFERMRRSPRGKPVIDDLLERAKDYFSTPVVHPDPSVPAQVKDRGDPPARAHDALAKQAGVMGYAYRIAGQERYARRAREILLGYAKLYPEQYKEHKGVNGADTGKVMAQRLSEAMWLIPLIQTYDLAGDAACFSAEDRQLIEEDLIRAAIIFINRKKSASDEVAEKTARNPSWRTDPAINTGKRSVGNWSAFYNMAFIQGGIVLGDQNWIDLGADGLKSMLENGIGEDGMWGEGAIGYQQFARHAMVGGLESLARKGIDLWSYKDCVFKNLFDSQFRYAYPDGTAPGINDSGRAPIGSGWTAMAFDYAYLRYGDPAYAVTINDTQRQLHHSPACYFPTQIYRALPEVPLKGQSSLVFDNLGYAILRGEGGGSDTFLLMDYGPHGGVHGHYDKLNLILYADGDELAGEPQGFRYEDRRHQSWSKTSIAHWTLSVDGHSQNPTTGRLICFADEGDIKVMRGQAVGAYAGVALDRTVVQMPGYMLDVFRAWGPAEHTFDYPLCFRGKLDRLEGLSEDQLRPMATLADGYQHIVASGPQAVEKAWTGLWRREAADANPDAETTDEKRGGPANEVRATVLPASAMQSWVGKVPGKRAQAVFRQQGRDVTFACLVDPYRASDIVEQIESVPATGPVPASVVKVTLRSGATDWIVVRHDAMLDGQPAERTTFAEFDTRSLVDILCLDEAGEQTRRVQLGGQTAP